MIDGDILALDLGQTSGWALVSKRRPPLVGTIVLSNTGKDGQFGYRWNELEQRLDALIAEHPSIAEIYYEAPVTRMGPDASLVAMMVLVGYAVCAEKAAARVRKPISLGELSSVRLQVLGKGRFGKRTSTHDPNKDAAKAWCERHGLPGENEHVADALILSEYAANCQGNGWSLMQTKWYGDQVRARG